MIYHYIMSTSQQTAMFIKCLMCNIIVQIWLSHYCKHDKILRKIILRKVQQQFLQNAKNLYAKVSGSK